MFFRVVELCAVECFCCGFGDAGLKYSCMRKVRSRGLEALGMSTRVVELCVVVEYFVVVLLVLDLNSFAREVFKEGVQDRLG